MWSPNITGSDAAIYMESARNVAEGKGFVSSVCRFNMDEERLANYIAQYGNRYQGSSRAPVYVYALSGIYLLTGKAHFMTGVNLFNILLLVLSLITVYWYMLRRFPGRTFAHFAAILWIGGSYTLFEYSYCAWLESFTLFAFVISFVYHSFIVNEDDYPWWHFLLYALALASLFTVKRSNMPMVAAFLLHLLFQKRFKRIVMPTLFFGLFIGLWYGMRLYVMRIPPLYPFSHGFPFEGLSREVSAVPRFFFSPHFASLVFEKILEMAMSMKNLGLLFPFTIIYLASYPNDKDKQLVWLLLLTTFGIYMLSRGAPNARYIFPIFAVLMIFSAVVLDRLLQAAFEHKQLMPRYFLIMFTLFFQIKYITNFNKLLLESAPDRNSIFAAADDLLRANNIPKDAVILSNIVGYNIYTDHGYVLAPPNMHLGNKESLLTMYDVDYVLYCIGRTRYFGWNEFTVRSEEFRDLPLIEQSSSDDRVMLYKARKQK